VPRLFTEDVLGGAAALVPAKVWLGASLPYGFDPANIAAR
jgi:hypothetical protein